MRYLLLILCIIGVVAYIFVGGIGRASQDRNAPVGSRSQEVWERISTLEHKRRAMLSEAKGRFTSSSPRIGLSRRSSYGPGYREGFNQGYFEGSFLAQARQPNPLFFTVPNPR